MAMRGKIKWVKEFHALIAFDGSSVSPKKNERWTVERHDLDHHHPASLCAKCHWSATCHLKFVKIILAIRPSLLCCCSSSSSFLLSIIIRRPPCFEILTSAVRQTVYRTTTERSASSVCMSNRESSSSAVEPLEMRWKHSFESPASRTISERS